jgi:alginate O-acetyltransferase complex protein AlgI
MLFNSYIFLFIFLPVTLLGFLLFSRIAGPKYGKGWLTLASLFFYGWWNPIYLGLIIPSILANFCLGNWIQKRACLRLPTTPITFFAVAANLLVLGYFKYAEFLSSNLSTAFGVDWSITNVVLPLGISFFTFTQIAFILDARRGLAGTGSLSDFFLFVTFFPHLIAGPVIHHSQMMPQFENPKTYRFNWDNFAVGLWIFAAGLAKKVLIADGLSTGAGRVFTAASSGVPIFTVDAWAGVLAYTFQIYFDFSGYSDMAIGLAKIFGIVLPLNFNSPYKAGSMIEFWRRWHMTLSQFLKDYVYIPLGGNRIGPIRTHFNLLATMLIGGIWHGAGWTFAVWGGLHGGVLALNHWWRSSRHGIIPPSFRLPGSLHAWIGRLATLATVIIGWVFFRSNSIEAAAHLLGSMFGTEAGPPLGTEPLLKAKMWIWFGLLLLWVWFLPNVAEITSKQLPYAEVSAVNSPEPLTKIKLQYTPLWAALAGLLMALAILSMGRASEFLYYNF